MSDAPRLPHLRCADCGWVGTNVSDHAGAHPRTAHPDLPDSESTDRHGAGDAGLNELIAANVAGELEAIALDLFAAGPVSSAMRLRKIAAGIRRAMAQDRGSQGSSTGDGEDGTERPVPSPWDPHGREGES